MSQPASPAVPGNAAGRHPQDLTPPAIEAVLADFRSWLQQLASAPAAEPDRDGTPAAPFSEPIDLHTLLGQFLALRHEVNLQTKAVRAQQEQNGETLRQFSQALQALAEAQEAAGQAERQSQEELLRPILKTLVDLHDALAPAEREVQRLSGTLAPELDQLAELAQSAAPPRQPSVWGKLFGSKPAPAPSSDREERRRQAEQAVHRVRQLLGSLLTGYTMSLQRLERVLQQQGLEPIRCVGQSFDPERMEVIDVVADSGRPAGEVIEEVRRGYLWRGRVFRYAQVRVARP
jgi:molecular chaperone GrpE